jgi:hypothetical protein
MHTSGTTCTWQCMRRTEHCCFRHLITHTCIHTCTCTYINVYIHAYIFKGYVRMEQCRCFVYKRACIHACLHADIIEKYMCMEQRRYFRLQTCMHATPYIHTFAYMHTRRHYRGLHAYGTAPLFPPRRRHKPRAPKVRDRTVQQA